MAFPEKVHPAGGGVTEGADVFVGSGGGVLADVALGIEVAGGVKVVEGANVVGIPDVPADVDIVGEGSGVEVARGIFNVTDGVTGVKLAETQRGVSLGVSVWDGMEETCPVIVTSLVSSISAGSIVMVKEMLFVSVPPLIFTGVFILVNVALGRKGVSVAVPERSLFTIFIPELQAAADQVIMSRVERMKNNRLVI